MASQPQHSAPEGMEPYDLGGPGDLGALSKEQQQKLNDFKVKTRIDNEQYLRAHPEVQCLLAGFLGQVLLKRPEDIREFAADYFTSSDLPSIVEKQLEERQMKLKQNHILKKI